MRAVLRDLDENHLVVRARSLVVRGLLEKIDRDADDPFRSVEPEPLTLSGERGCATPPDSALLEGSASAKAVELKAREIESS